jgi:hypothetical protein
VIIVDHGLADSVNPKIDEAIGKGIPVVVYDVNIANCKATYISQDDASIATKILDYLNRDNPRVARSRTSTCPASTPSRWPRTPLPRAQRR